MATMQMMRSRLGGLTYNLEDGTTTTDGPQGAGVSVVWDALLNSADVGQAFSFGQFADRSVQVEGSFGTVVIEGSLDGVNYHTLTDGIGNILSFTSAAIKSISEFTKYVRPRCTAGVGVAIVVTIACRHPG